MSLRVRCPSCQEKYVLGAAMVAKKVRCRKCGEAFQVPARGSGEALDDKIAADEGLDDEVPARPGRRSPRAEDERRRRPHQDVGRSDRAARRPAYDNDEDEPPRRRPRERRFSPAARIAGVAAGLIVIAAIVVVVINVTSGSKDKRPGQPPVPPIAMQPGGPGMLGPQGLIDVEPGKPLEPLPANQATALPREKEPLAQDTPVLDPPLRDAADAAKGPPKKDDPPPDNIAADAVLKVKRCTVYLRVQLANERTVEGSGFFAVEPGIVLTNAHVVGMLQAESRRPKKIDVVVNSGQADERRLSGSVLDVDRLSDLAVVSVPKDDKLPPPLHVRSAEHLTELQKVFIFGFPFGAQLGKNITVTASTVSSLRRNAYGAIDRVQVHGGMHPGNSGGPVVDTRGDVIGVSVAVLKNTQIHFAVPGDQVHTIANGRLSSTVVGHPYREGDQIKLNFEMVLIDPLKRIKNPRVEYWYGMPGAARPPSRAKPEPKPDDGPRQVVDLAYQDGRAKGTLLWPAAEAGKVADVPGDPGAVVLYTQPVYTNGAGETRWVTAASHQFFEPTELKPAMLQAKYAETQRPIEIISNARLRLITPDSQYNLTLQTHAALTERTRRLANGCAIDLQYHSSKIGVQIEGHRPPENPLLRQTLDALNSAVVQRVLDGDGNVLRFGLDMSNVPLFLQPQVGDLHQQIGGALEALMIPLPNRRVQPGESWTADRWLPVRAEQRIDTAVLKMKFIYEGLRKRQGREEAVIRIEGEVRGAGEQERLFGGRVDGRALVDLAFGQVTQAKITVILDMDGVLADGHGQCSGTLEARLQRGLTSAASAQRRESVRSPGRLEPADPKDPSRDGYRKVYSFPMVQGKTYVIDMMSSDANFDPFLRLQDAAGKPLDEDDDSGGGLNARIIFLCPATADYRIVCTTFDPNQVGTYVMTIAE